MIDVVANVYLKFSFLASFTTSDIMPTCTTCEQKTDKLHGIPMTQMVNKCDYCFDNRLVTKEQYERHMELLRPIETQPLAAKPPEGIAMRGGMPSVAASMSMPMPRR